MPCSGSSTVVAPMSDHHRHHYDYVVRELSYGEHEPHIDLLAEWRKLADSVDGWAYSDSMEDEAFSRDARQPFARLLDAVQAVLDLHQPDEMRMRDYITATGVAQEAPCMECGDRHPCPTVRAITDSLTAASDE